MSSAVRPIWRARIASGRRRTTASAAHATAGARITEPSTPSLAWERCSPPNARLAISSETVNPMPAQAPPTASSGPLTGARGPCRAGREANHEPANTPTGLPTT